MTGNFRANMSYVIPICFDRMLCFVQIVCLSLCKKRRQLLYSSMFDDLVPSHSGDDPLPNLVAGHAAKGPEKKGVMLGEGRKLETIVEEGGC